MIGEELRSRDLSGGEELIVIGADALTRRYARAFAQRDVRVRSVGAQATWNGLFGIAKRMGA